MLDLYKGYADQYLMLECRPGAHSSPPLPAEQDLQKTLHQVATFRERIDEKFTRFRSQIQRLVDASARIVLWGSGSKAVSYLNTLELRDEIGWIVDINPFKHGKFLAGTGHEIVAPDFLREYRPDAVIIMNAIYVDEIQRDLEGMGLSPELIAI